MPKQTWTGWMFDSIQTGSWIVPTRSNCHVRKRSLKKRNQGGRKKKHPGKGSAGGLFRSVKLEMKTKTPCTSSLKCQNASMWHRYLNDQSGPEYASQMNNSAGEPQIDLTVVAADVTLWSLLNNKRRQTPPGCCIRHPTMLKISGRCRAEVIPPQCAGFSWQAPPSLRTYATWNFFFFFFFLTYTRHPLTGTWHTFKWLRRDGRHYDR